MLSDEVTPSSLSDLGAVSGDSVADSRRQYTLKGVESEAIDLMRLAANSQGVKIGHWVSERLKEAALRTLNNDSRQREVLARLSGSDPVLSVEKLGNISEDLDGGLAERVSRIERDVQELLRSQRDIMHLVLSKML